ncbi:glutamate--cysteine ligase [Leptolyngbya sp. FACHB-261]|uniref:glutamate--cysteine ligase n=1 Tax=Leptolyngbya sp. FACHB-261 TaxID=2692806 RepID=UPI00168A16C6|nr:glutamate--cysteine ligase [Leptolyngbya sp. FACHB-261]MBD2104586.1 glutamate--cysteine ligase [Leptolyngbya sp. FACHB-261]
MLSKGFEVEMYTSTPTGEVVGLSDRIVAALSGFVREPDSRNVEYTTAPFTRYEPLIYALLQPRRRLRTYLHNLGNYTLLPGSTLPLVGQNHFVRSDPGNHYHSYIERTYGTRVVTASIHINVGIPDPELLMRACRLIRMEAALYLALSASSPFLEGKATGSHSSRWQVFPRTPEIIPLWESHAHFIAWTEEQLRLGTMQNVRHLWSSVRPNGSNRPHNLNRLELRICDLVSDPLALLAITALLETRLISLMQDPVNLDPLHASPLSLDQLAEIANQNEAAAARDSLDAELIHWQTGSSIRARDWIEALYSSGLPLARQQGFSCFLLPLKTLLREGNEAQRWLSHLKQGASVTDIVVQSIEDLAALETELERSLGLEQVA